MEVFAAGEDGLRLVGHADVRADSGPVLEVPLFGPHAVIRERFTIGTVTHQDAQGGPPAVVRAVLLAPGQLPDLLPGWRPLPQPNGGERG
jgi:hypothetical protein